MVLFTGCSQPWSRFQLGCLSFCGYHVTGDGPCAQLWHSALGKGTFLLGFIVFFKKWNCLGRHWFAKLYMFQMYNSTKLPLHTVSCTHSPRQSLFPFPSHPFAPPPLSLHTPLPSGHNYTVVCVLGLRIYVLWLIPITFLHPVLPPLPSDNCLSVCSMYPCLRFFTFVLGWPTVPGHLSGR